MLRRTLIALALLGSGCHHDPQPVAPGEGGELPPLPPASGTPVGYLLDNADKLALTGEQIDKLKKIDNSLSAQNDGIQTQLREIEKPEDDEDEAPHKPKPGEAAPKPKNNAPGAYAVHQTAGSEKLHAAIELNNKDALQRAFAILDDTQKATARKLLDDRGVAAPGGAAPGKNQPPPPASGEDNGGVPLEP